MAINRIESLQVSSNFTPQSGAIASNDNANVALQKLQGSKANLISSPTNGNIVNTDANGQSVDSGVKISTDHTLSGGDGEVPTSGAVQSYVALHATIGLQLKYPCVVATTANITLNGLMTIDGYGVQNGDRVFVKNQTNAAENGIYTANASNNWPRSSDADTWALLVGAYSLITDGTVNGGQGWAINVQPGGTLGTDPVTSVQVTEGTGYQAGTGLTLTAQTFSITDTAVVADSYGSAANVPTFSVNAQGQLTSASDVAIAIAGSQITSGTVDQARLPANLQFAYNGTATNAFNAAYSDQTFNADLSINVTTMTTGLDYSFLASGQDVTITFTNGSLEGFNVQGTSTTQLITNGAVLVFRRVSSSVVRLK